MKPQIHLRYLLTASGILFCIMLCCLSCDSPPAESPTTEQAEPASPESTFDQEAATKYGADDYGMRPYVMAFLKRGPNRDRDSTEAVQLQAAHMANIRRLAEAGKLSLAGPFLDNGELRGIYIFNVATVEEAEALTNTDPAIKAGSLVMELKPWYGSAALMAVNEIHKTLQNKSISE